MPVIYISKELYDELVKLGEDPGRFAAEAIKERLVQERLKLAKKEAGKAPPEYKGNTKGL